MKLSQKELAAALNKKESSIRSAISRKTLQIESDKKIDTNHPKNKAYIQKASKGKGLILNNAQNITQKPKGKNQNSNQNNQTKENKQENKQENSPTTTYSGEKDKMYEDKLEQEILKLQKENIIKQIEIDKKKGNLIPVDMVESILTINLQSVFRAMENEGENLVTIAVASLGGDREHIAHITDSYKQSLQDRIQEAGKQALEEVKNLIVNYQAVRSRGEKR